MGRMHGSRKEKGCTTIVLTRGSHLGAVTSGGRDPSRLRAVEKRGWG